MTLHWDYLHRSANFCTIVSNIFFKTNSYFPHHQTSKTNFWSHMKHLKSWKYWWIETDNIILLVIAHFLWTSKFIFSCFNGKLFFVLYSGNYLYRSSAFRKYKSTVRNILKGILVQGFCSLKTEISRFPLGFRLKVYLRRTYPDLV